MHFWTGALDVETSAGAALLGSSMQRGKQGPDPGHDRRQEPVECVTALAGARQLPAEFARPGLLDHGKAPLYNVAGISRSNEFAGPCGGMRNSVFAGVLYQNVLHRAGDAVGRRFWTGALSTGS